VDLSEAISAGISVSDITVQTNYLQGNAKVGSLTAYNGSSSIYYLEVSYVGDSLYPGTQDSYKREAQFRISLPQNAAASSWDPTNDWSYKTVATSSQTAMKAVNMPIYDNGVQIWGAEPNKPAVNAVVAPKIGSTSGNRLVAIRQHGTRLEFSGLGPTVCAVSIISASGKTILKNAPVQSSAISLAHASSGVYICVFSEKSGSAISSQSMVIQR
jgi:hypothetical protein